MNKAALIIPYFGKWPEWIDLYLYSCSKQRNIDFLIYTDCDIPQMVYPNTIFHEMSFEAYCQLVSERLAIPFKPRRAYKLCDLKPFYGIIHKKELNGYDWWGFGDIDLVYGDLSLLLNEANMNKYDLLTTHVDRIAGHFTVIRKDSKYTNSCFDIPDWKEKLCDEKNYGLDEGAFTQVVRPIKYRIIGLLYYHFIGKLTSPLSKFYWYSKLEQMFRLWNTRVLMTEFFTTFRPRPGLSCNYHLVTNDIDCPVGQLTKIKYGGVNCIFISCVLKRLHISKRILIGEMDSTRYLRDMILPKVAWWRLTQMG